MPQETKSKILNFSKRILTNPLLNNLGLISRSIKILLDPPRSGAAFALNALCELKAEKILYVSCNPATLVRDAEILRDFGYKIEKSSVIDMFPHTGHLESITLFTTK